MSPWPNDDAPDEFPIGPQPCDRYPDECGGQEPVCTWPNCVDELEGESS